MKLPTLIISIVGKKKSEKKKNNAQTRIRTVVLSTTRRPTNHSAKLSTLKHACHGAFKSVYMLSQISLYTANQWLLYDSTVVNRSGQRMRRGCTSRVSPKKNTLALCHKRLSHLRQIPTQPHSSRNTPTATFVLYVVFRKHPRNYQCTNRLRPRSQATGDRNARNLHSRFSHHPTYGA